MHGRLSVKMEYFRRYLLTHGEPDGFPRLENDLVFYLEVQKFKVRNIYHLYLITPAKDLKGSLNSAWPTNNRNLQGWQEISFLEYLVSAAGLFSWVQTRVNTYIWTDRGWGECRAHGYSAMLEFGQRSRARPCPSKRTLKETLGWTGGGGRTVHSI